MVDIREVSRSHTLVYVVDPGYWLPHEQVLITNITIELFPEAGDDDYGIDYSLSGYRTTRAGKIVKNAFKLERLSVSVLKQTTFEYQQWAKDILAPAIRAALAAYPEWNSSPDYQRLIDE